MNFNKMIKADLKHWAGKKEKKGRLQVDYNTFAQQIIYSLGTESLVGIPNAREDEFRFEELYGMAKNINPITSLGDKGVFHDDKYKIWFVKVQEINTKVDDKKLTYLIYNLPFDENFNEENNEALKDSSTIKILNLPSCIGQLEYKNKLLEKLKYFDGIVIHAGSMTIFPEANKKAEGFYNKFIQDNSFYNPLQHERHKIGAIVVSGGHRSPKSKLVQKLIPPSIGSGYTEVLEFTGNTQEDFFNWLRDSIQNSTPENLHKGSCAREMLFRHIPSMIVSKYFKK